MTNSLVRGVELIREEGVISVVKRGSEFLRRSGQNKIGSLPMLKDLCYRVSSNRLASLPDDQGEFDRIIAKTNKYSGLGVHHSIAPMQESDEIGALATIVKDQQPSTVVEIGTAHGGTLYIWSRYLNADTIVAVDNSLYFKARARLFREFDGNIDYTFLNTSSHQQSTAEIISNTVSDEIDFLFIDGDHRYDGVKQDFELYSPLVSDGGIIAFHDIIEVDKPWMGVPTFWNEIKGQYQTDEIILPPNKERGGIGVIYK